MKVAIGMINSNRDVTGVLDFTLGQEDKCPQVFPPALLLLFSQLVGSSSLLASFLLRLLFLYFSGVEKSRLFPGCGRRTHLGNSLPTSKTTYRP